MQSTRDPRSPGGAGPGPRVGDAPLPYAATLDALEPALDELAVAVASDLAGGAPAAAAVAEARRTVEELLASLRKGPIPGPDTLERLREAAAGSARAGGPLQPLLDATLSAGWVLWAAATARPGLDPAALAALGDALLRTGDAAATAIADGHAAAGRELARRSASDLRELLDELLELADGDDTGRARLGRRLGEIGLDPSLAVRLVVVDAARDLHDGDPEVVEVARRLGRGSVAGLGDPRALGGPGRPPVVASSRGRLVVLVPSGGAGADVDAALGLLGAGWVGVETPATDLLGTGAALREATAGLSIARRLGRIERIVPVTALALERALLADPELLAVAVERELGPLLTAPRGGPLIGTLEAYLAERENLRATARRLGLAPRTVAYRLERIERLLGGRLDGERLVRLAAVLFSRRLLDGTPATNEADGRPR